MAEHCRHLIVVLGDQLDPTHVLIRNADPERDRVWMAEVPEEATHVWSHKARIALFLSAMRHFRDSLDMPVDYLETGAHSHQSLGEALDASLRQRRPEAVLVLQPGDWRVQEALRSTCAAADVPLTVHEDPHFLCRLDAFADWADGRKRLRMEDFYRWMRKRTRILMTDDGKPMGGQWNFDQANRDSFGKQGPGEVPAPPRFEPDDTTQAVLALVEGRHGDHPGSLSAFAWPVTPQQARAALDAFVEHRLPLFGRYQDAMWTDEPALYHSLLSAAMNLKLLAPQTVIDAAVLALEQGHAPIEAVEGFVRQVLGWREYVRGLYFLRMPDFLSENALDARERLPELYWNGDTDMQCLSACIGQTLEFGYAHHIQRLMVTGLFSLLLGVRPRDIHAWYLAVYVDAVEWVELPNTLGMSQYADGGILGTKPYVASGKYIARMSNYCSTCRFDPADATTDSACPFTTLYWDFLGRHGDRFSDNRRMTFQLRNHERKNSGERAAISRRANAVRAALREGRL